MSAEKRYNWAILGCGKIAQKFSKDLQLLEKANLYACASRKLDRAKKFADKFGFEKAYGSYAEMVCNPEIDIVYIATPHTFHKTHTLLCLEQRKAVLCEKAFAINEREVQQMIAASKKKQTSHLASMPDWFKIKFLHSRTQDSGCKMANFTQIVEPVIQHFNPIFATQFQD